MKAHSSQLISIEEIVDKALSDLGEDGHRKENFLMWALDAYRKYRMDHAREVKTVSLDMTAWKSIILPDDCVDWILVGIRNGEMIDTFTRRTLFPRECACDKDAPEKPTYKENYGEEGFSWFNFTEYGEDPGKMYGLQHKDNGLGYFSPNQNEGVNEIQLSAKVKAGTKIYLMYLGTLFDPRRDQVIHPYYEDMIRAFIHWKNLQNKRRAGNRNISPNDIAEAKNEFDNELVHAVERRWDLSYEDVIAASREGYMQVPKN